MEPVIIHKDGVSGIPDPYLLGYVLIALVSVFTSLCTSSSDPCAVSFPVEWFLLVPAKHDVVGRGRDVWIHNCIPLQVRDCMRRMAPSARSRTSPASSGSLSRAISPSRGNGGQIVIDAMSCASPMAGLRGDLWFWFMEDFIICFNKTTVIGHHDVGANLPCRWI